MFAHRIRLIAVALCLAGGAGGCRWIAPSQASAASVAASREYAQRGLAALERGDFQTGEQALARAVKACPTDAEARGHYAGLLYRQGRLSEAKKAIDEALVAAPNHAGLQLLAADVALAANDPVGAEAAANAAVEIDPNLAAAWLLRARIKQTTGRPQQALSDACRALRLTPRDVPTLALTAELYQQLGRPERSVAALKDLADCYPPGQEPASLWTLRGRAYASMGRPDDAAACFASAVSRGATSPDAYAMLAEAQMRAGRPDDAARSLERALAQQPNHPPSLALRDGLPAGEIR